MTAMNKIETAIVASSPDPNPSLEAAPPRRCQGCGRIEGEAVDDPVPDHGHLLTLGPPKPPKPPIVLRSVLMLDYGSRLLCARCERLLYRQIERLGLARRTRGR
jgi:hypothetical protein